MWPATVDTAVLVLNFSYVLIVLALILRDILWLRDAWTGGQVFMIMYGILSNEPVILAGAQDATRTRGRNLVLEAIFSQIEMPH